MYDWPSCCMSNVRSERHVLPVWTGTESRWAILVLDALATTCSHMQP